ncbi:MAG: AAA family ATPase [Candidatus Micrarchaeota archaeon]|nr:AAA family ATPase [Candidatus Micrarchaeota archaeon]
MASNVFRQLSAEGGLFADESVLRPEFMPDELLGREREMRELAGYLQEAARGRAPPATLLIGPPGTGKTTTSKLLLKQLEEVSRKPLALYINCWETPTRFGILNALVIGLGDMLPRRGIAVDEVVARLNEIGRRQERIPIVVLDEADRLLASPAHEDRVLYDLSRAQEALGLKVGLIAISNDTALPVKLDARVRSSLTNHRIDFAPYNPAQLKAILNERAGRAFRPGALDAEVVPLCAAVGAKAGGDARVSLHLLWAAGKKAESAGAKKVEVAHVKAAQSGGAVEEAATPAVRKTQGLDEMDARIIALISKAGKNGLESGEIYKDFGAGENEQRNIRNRLLRLEKSGLIAGETAPGGGNVRCWKLCQTA